MIRNLLKRVPGARKVARALGLGGGRDVGRKFLLAQLPKGGVGAEIGVHLGDFSREILEVAMPRELNLIDPWKHQVEFKDAWYGGKVDQGQVEMDARHENVCSRFADEIASGSVKVHRGFSVEMMERFPDAYFDWVYIDANHLYDYVARDLEVSFRKVKPGGIVAGDDYKEGGWWGGGVKKAVDEYAAKPGCQLVGIRHSQFIFRKA